MRDVTLFLIALWLPSISFAQSNGEGASQLAPPPPTHGSAPTGVIPPPSYHEQAGSQGTTAPVPSPPVAGYPRSNAAGGYAATYEGVPVPTRLAARLRVLEADLTALSLRSGSSNIVDGVLSLITGGLGIGLGFAVHNTDLRNYLFLFGGGGIARGLISLAVSPNPGNIAIEYSHMPMSSPALIQARLKFGEDSLRSLANRTRLARILDSVISIGVGVAIIPIFLGPNNFEVDAFSTFVIIGAVISAASGTVNLLSRSEAERRWNAYQDLRDRLERQSPPAVGRMVGASGLL